MEPSHRRARGVPLWKRCHGTPISLTILGIVAAMAGAGPTIATASVGKRIHPVTTASPVPAPAPSATIPSGSGGRAPGSPTTAPAATSAPADTGHTATSSARSPSSVASPPVPSGVDLDAGVPGVAPPSSIAANCSVDVSGLLQKWLGALPAGTLVRPAAGACYRVDRGITLSFPHGLTLDGGTYKNTVTPQTFTGHKPGRPTFTVIGGSDVTFEDLTITGTNPGGYHSPLAFEAGIELQGTAQATIRNLAVDHVYGDGITLAPLLGGRYHDSGLILAPTADLTIDTVDIKGSGRQGIGLVSVDGAHIDNVALQDVGLSTFDFEANEAKEGARDVTIDGCTSSTWNGGAFFANAGTSFGSATRDIVVENCRMLHPQGGDAVVVDNARGASEPRGPITFSDDTLDCGASAYVGCFQLDDATVSVTNSVIQFPKRNRGPSDLYHAGGGSTLSLVDDSVQGWKMLGQRRATSTVSVTGGTWRPAYDPSARYAVVTVSHRGTPRHIAIRAAHRTAIHRRVQRRAQRRAKT